MDLKVSPLKPMGLSPSDCISDPEKEVSDEDDDDRNHKHRRRETSQSLERDSLEPAFTRPYRRQNKPLENGLSFHANESQVSETWKNLNLGPMEKFTSKFDKRHPSVGSLSRTPQDLNQRNRSSQISSGDPGLGRGRGRDNQCDTRFNSVDIVSQMVQQGSINSSLFAVRGLPTVSNAQTASWNAFRLIPGIPNGGLDTFHPISLQGSLRSAVNPSLNMGIPRQRCRDFEERGFCLRGDMCPMEHGVNRIVVEDVQSLSQFNLPVSIPSGQVVGMSAGPRSIPTVGSPSTAMVNSKGIRSKNSKSGIGDDSSGLNGAYSSCARFGGADLYDPDQPLWNNSIPGTSSPVLSLHSPKNDDTESLINVDPSDHHLEEYDGVVNDCPARNTRNNLGSQSANSSVWSRIGRSKNGLDVKDKTDPTVSTSYSENGPDKEQNALGNSDVGKQIIVEDSGPKNMDSSAKTENENLCHMRRPSQKAVRTLFVNGIPQKNQKREGLLSHFQKFGEVIDIYIPANSERAFVQFSKREEAEAALRAPDAVMGNRFIKLRWANWDSIPDDGVSSSSTVTTHHSATASIQPHPSITNRGRDNPQSAVTKNTAVSHSDPSFLATDYPKPAMMNGTRDPLPLQKKLETLEQLKEELRKKQELLDQKRNDFKRQLDKLEKQASGVKTEVMAEPAVKRHKPGIAVDSAKDSILRPFNSVTAAATPCAESLLDRNKATESVVLSSPKSNTVMGLPESMGSKQPIHLHPFAGSSFLVNRYKLDNRPTTFRIIPPLPDGLKNFAALKEHFSSYGELSSVELEDFKSGDDDIDESELLKSCSAHVTFTTRHSAERAFSNGKCWQGNNLQFMWVPLGTSSKDHDVREMSLLAPKCPVKVDVQGAEDTTKSGNKEAEHSERELASTACENSAKWEEPGAATVSCEIMEA